MTSSVMRVEGLGISFGGLKAVDDVTFDVGRFQVTTVIGPNGAGKSTLFNLISGALRPRSGRVLIEGIDLTGKSPQQIKAHGLSRSFQITNLFFELSVRENLRLAAQDLEPSRFSLLPTKKSARALAKVDEMLERFGLGAKADELAGSLSHGEQRRLEIAVCLASEPNVLLLDEPTQGMSQGDTDETRELISSLASTVTILLIEHDVGLVMSISDYIVVMHQGRKLAAGDPQSVRANAAVQAAYFGHKTVLVEEYKELGGACINWGTLGSDQEESRRIQSSDWPSWYLFRRVEIIAAGLEEAIQGWADSWRDGAKKL